MALFNYESLASETIIENSYDFLKENKQFCNAEDIHINESDEYDIFLSHSYTDRKIIPKLKKEIENLGYKVYVDWIDDKLLNRDMVTKTTAKVLQKRMQQSKSLFFATSENSPKSKWMPWELGYFDGIKNKRVAILPIKKDNNDFDENFHGQEYLGLYDYVIIDSGDKYIGSCIWGMEKKAFNEFVKKLSKRQTLYIHENLEKYSLFEKWIEGDTPMKNEERIVKEFIDIFKGDKNE